MDNVITSLQDIYPLLLGGVFSVTWSAVLYALFGLIVAIVVMILLRRSKIARRENKLWNFATNLHHLIILFTFVICFTLFGAVRATHKLVADMTSTYLQPTVETQVTTIQNTIVRLWPPELRTAVVSVKETTDRVIASLYYQPSNDEFFGEQKARLINWMIDELGRKIVSTTITSMINAAIERTANTVGLDSRGLTYSVEQIKQYDFSKSGKQIAASVVRSVNRYIDNFFKGQYLNILLLFALLLAIPVIEILFYHFIWKRRREKAKVDTTA